MNRAVVKEEVKNDGTDSAWMRRHLSDSVYLWACGEKANDEDDDTQLCDRLIGWLILFVSSWTWRMTPINFELMVMLASSTASPVVRSSVRNGIFISKYINLRNSVAFKDATSRTASTCDIRPRQRLIQNRGTK